MHELSIATEIYRSCRAELERERGGALIEVRVAVGELSAVEPDLLRFAWEAVTADGPDAGAKLEVEWHPVRQLCTRCGEIAERQPGSWLRLCPQCEGPLDLQGGDELDLVSLGFASRDMNTDTTERADSERADSDSEVHP